MNIPENWLKVPFYRAYKFFVFLPLIATASCSFISDKISLVQENYIEDSPFVITKYNQDTEEKPYLKFNKYEGYDLKISDKEFYIRKTVKLTDLYPEWGKKYRKTDKNPEIAFH